MTATPKTTVSVAGGVMTITMVDEENRNTLTAQLLDELFDAIETAEADSAVRVVVITNSGSVFCAGANLSERNDDAGGAPRHSMAELLTRIRRSPLPFVGRIAGHAVAGGLGLAAAMDLSVAVDTAKHGFTEVRIGVAPAIISVICLQKMSRPDAVEAMLRGNRFLAPEAARLGLINKAVPAAELDAEVDAIVADLLLGGPEAIAATKSLLDRVPGMPLDDAFSWTSQLSGQLFLTDEAKAGMTAYLNRQPAPWVPSSPDAASQETP